MRYLLDTNSLSNKITNPLTGRDDLYVIEEVVDEYAYSKIEAQKVTRAGIKVLDLHKEHLEKMKEIMKANGTNFKLIRLYTSTGIGDVAILSYVLAERDNSKTLFPESYTVVTKDVELRRVAENYGINCVTEI